MKEFEDIENCINGIEHAITDLETELFFLRKYLDSLKNCIQYGQRRNEQI